MYVTSATFIKFKARGKLEVHEITKFYGIKETSCLCAGTQVNMQSKELIICYLIPR